MGKEIFESQKKIMHYILFCYGYLKHQDRKSYKVLGDGEGVSNKRMKKNQLQWVIMLSMG